MTNYGSAVFGKTPASWFDSNAGHLAAFNQPHTSFSPLKRAAVICVAVALRG